MLLTVFAAADSRIVRRWSLPGDPHGIAVSADGTLYVGLAKPQAVAAIDPSTGKSERQVVLDSPEIASTKELVTLRIDRTGKRLFIANGSDESASILSLPALSVLREITMEGEEIRDALPDPHGRFVYLLGRHVHVYDFAGEKEIRTIPIDDPTAIAANGNELAVFDAKGVTTFDASGFRAIAHQSLPAAVRSALFAGDALIGAAGDALFEIAHGRVIRDTICLPVGSGPQSITAAGAKRMLLAERTCHSSALIARGRTVTPMSLYGVDAYAIAYDPARRTLYTVERAGYVTAYRVSER